MIMIILSIYVVIGIIYLFSIFSSMSFFPNSILQHIIVISLCLIIIVIWPIMMIWDYKYNKEVEEIKKEEAPK